MRTALAGLLLTLVAGAQESRAPDPAALLPFQAPIFAEATGLSDAAARLRGADVFARALGPVAQKELDTLLADVAALGIRRVAFAYAPALVFGNRWLVVADVDDPAPLVAFIVKRRAGKENETPVAGAVGPFHVVADSADTIAAAAKLAKGAGRPLSERDDFRRFRARLPAGALRLHLDVKKLAPPWLRGFAGIRDGDDAFGVLLGHHLTHALKTARTLSAALRLDDGVALSAVAEVDPMPAKTAFTETRPAHAVLAAPEGTALYTTLARDLTSYWNNRQELLSEKARGLAEFQNNATILLGGVSVEDFFAALGTSFDGYVTRGDETARPGYRYPAAALAGVVRDPAMATTLVLSFQTTIGIVNAQRSMDGQPRFFQESASHRGVLVTSARLLPETLRDDDDERLQFAPSFAIARDRFILGTNRRIVKDLVDAALDGRTVPRPPGDTAMVSGPPGAVLVRDAAAFIRGKQALEHGRKAEAGNRVVEALASVLEKLDRGRLSVDVEGDVATVVLEAQGARLLDKAPESREAR